MGSTSRLSTLFVIVFLALTTCCQRPSTPRKNTLFLNLKSDPQSLDPRVVREVKDLTLTKQLFEGLMRLDKEGVPQCAVARSYDVSSDGLTYTFFLKDTFWNNEKPVTATDFEYSWKRVLDPNFVTDYAHMLFLIKNGKAAKCNQCALDQVGVKAIDDTTLVVTLEQNAPYFLELLSFPTYSPIPTNLDAECANWSYPPGKNFICNGPFQIKQWENGITLILEKNPHYWDSQNVFLDALHSTIISDPMTESYLFEKGELDWLGKPLSHNIAQEIATKYKQEKKLLYYPIAGTFWIQFNVLKPPFNNVKFRKALCRAISRRELIDHILQGNQSEAHFLLPPSMALSSLAENSKQNANALFKEALDEMRYNKEDLPPLYLTFFSSERSVRIAEYIQDIWQETFQIPIKLEITELEHFKYKLRAGDFQMAPSEWIADFNDPISFLEIFEYRGGLNTTQWQDEKFASLLDEAVYENDLQKRREMLLRAEKILLDQAVLVPLYHYVFDYVKKDNVIDVYLSPLGLADFKCAKKLNNL